MSEYFRLKKNNNDLFVHLLEPGIHYTLWNRFKVWAWNLILPPHIRLKIYKPKDLSEDKE